MSKQRRYALLWLAVWLLAVLVGIFLRPLLPIDETRYVSVAWEMWDSRDFLVPMLNGEPYAHKPPLLFWLYHLGWWLFGVNDWWPRLLPALFALGTLYLTRQLAKILWPDQPRVVFLAPTILAGTMLWMLLASAAMFDMMLTFWVLLAVRGLLTAALEDSGIGEELLILSVSMGILTKGPVMLVHVLPLALILPLLLPELRERIGRWYGRVFVYTLAAVLAVLIWALPAALYAGDTYARAIFWGQTAGRAVDSFAHQRPWWWYFALAPMLFFPWLLWPVFWRSLAAAWRERADWGLRCCAAWVASTFLIFVLISGKQAHYLLPLMPGFALLAGRALAIYRAPVGIGAQWPVTAALVAAGAVALAAGEMPAVRGGPDWITLVLPYVGVVLLLSGALAALPLRRIGLEWRTLQLTAVVAVCFNLLAAIVYHYGHVYYDLRGVSEYLSDLQQRGRPLAHVGKYYDQFHFYGRLHWPISTVDENAALTWARSHRAGHIIVYYEKRPDTDIDPEYEKPYRGKWLAIWSSTDVVKHPGLIHSG